MTFRRFGGPGMQGVGGVPLSSLGGGALGGYFAKVLATGPIAYWPLWEPSGTTARCLVNPAQNGTYNSNVSTWPVGTGIGDGNTAPGFDGTNDVVAVHTATFQGRFNGGEGTAAAWAHVANAGVWTDGSFRAICNFQVDATNLVQIQKRVANDQLRFYYIAGGTTETVDHATTSTNWMHVAVTWSASAGVNGEVKAYYNGSQTGLTQTALGAWAGNITLNFIGGSSAVPAGPWNGGVAHCAVWDRPLADTEIAALYVL